MEKLDKIDKKILHELDFNSRQPISIIAKRLGISRDIISYRMKKYQKEEVISKYHTIIDIAKLGYSVHKVFLRLQDITTEKEKRLIKFIIENTNTVYSANYDGRFDIAISFWSKNVEALENNLKELDKKFGEIINEKQITSIIRGEYCARNYLIDKNRYKKRKSLFGSTPYPTKIDNIDKKILLELGKDSRVPAVEIATKLKIAADSVSKRIRKLEKSGIIQNYNIVPNEQNYPFLHYKILITLHNLSEEKEEKFKQYCRNNKNMWYFCSCVGAWNFEINLEVENQKEFRDILKEIKNNFSSIIKDYTIMTIYQTNKYNFYPNIHE